MSLLFGIKAEQQSAVADRPHIFSFATPRSVANDELVSVWNGATNAARKFAVDLNGRLHIGGLAAGDLIYGGAVLLTGTRRLESLVIGTANQVLRVNAGATAPEWASTLSGLTLTTPTINGAVLSGTFSGAPTFSGAVTASGGVSISGGVTPLTVSSGAICIRLITPTTGQNPQIVWSPNSVDRWVIYAVDSDSTFRVRDAVTPVDVLTFVVGGAATFAAAVTVTGLLTASAGITLTGTLTMATAVSILVPGATSFAVRDTANANNNLIVTNAGVLTIRAGLTVTAGGATITAGDVAITAGNLTFAAAAARLIPGVTSFSLRNNANNADNVLVSDAGLVTIRAGLTVTGTITMSTAVSKIVPGATSWGVRNNADSADNLIINDAGAVVFRAGVSGMTSLTMSVGGTINLGSGGIVGALNGSITMGNNGSISAGVNGSIASGTGGFDMGASGRYKLNGTQVVGPQITGYAAMTGTPNKASVYDTATVTLPQLAGRMMQLQADLTTHGLVGV